MRIRVVGTPELSCGDLVLAFSKLYRSDPRPPHFFLVYDVVYEPERSEVVVKPLPRGGVESYVLVWRGFFGYGIHVWGPSGCELLEGVGIEVDRCAYVQLYSRNGELIRCVEGYLRRCGFGDVAVRGYHEMVCSRDTFTPSSSEHLAVRLTDEYVNAFRDYMRSRGVELGLDEVGELLRRRYYYAVIEGGEIAATAAVCNRLPEVGVVCDVYTKPEFRGRGFAKAVVSATTRAVVESNALALLYVEVGNEPAMRVYESLGYRVSRTLPWVIGCP